MKKIKKYLSLLMCVMMVMSFSIMAFAADVSASVTASSGTPKVGTQITVTVKYTGSDIGSYKFNLSYNPSVLSYVSGADNSSDGTLNFVGVYTSAVSQVSRSVTFNVIAEGNSSLSTGGSQIVSFTNMTPLSSGENNISITTSADTVPPTTTPAKQTTIPATTSAPKPTVTEKPTVNESPTEKTEDITQNAVSQEAVTEKIEVPAGMAMLDDCLYQIVNDSAFISAPSGFSENSSLYNNETILSYKNEDSSVAIVWLSDDSGNTFPSLYSETKQKFHQYKQLSQFDTIITVIPSEIKDMKDVNKSLSLIPKTINGVTINAYVDKSLTENENYLFYAFDSAGKINIYIYDEVLKAFQRYIEPDSFNYQFVASTDVAKNNKPIIVLSLLLTLFTIATVVLCVLFFKLKKKFKILKNRPLRKVIINETNEDITEWYNLTHKDN